MNDESWTAASVCARQRAGWCCHVGCRQVESEELAVGCEEGLFEKIEYTKIGGEAAYLPPTVNSCGVAPS